MRVKNILKKIFFSQELKEIEKLKEENRKLKKENKKLHILNSSKDELISAVSHEFKNPISIINGYIETILTNELPDEMNRKFLNKIQRNSLRLSELIDRLYLITRLENEKVKIKFTKFDLCAATKNIIESFNTDRIELNCQKTPVYGDKTLIETVIYNLLSNAIKYSDDKITLNITDTYLEVIDKGKGIDEKEIELIKQKFYRIAKNDWDNSLGLGLAIVEKILKIHKTKLQIESQKGKGSRFYFDITSLKSKAQE
ncbi:two-component sensor histidine kinase [Nautilia sp. PV-1]|uniref:sensor histidine kinase n=1 Tax=Nautilia sp. PV-1 TaxID=2579250 RepID=UPI000FDC3964|nr:HAMP domain-containing sensor histidine kinase [Nautilia sp. PV-1]AZV46002.1 two-component sensor histidine kinase [Nautilia sp. PV-1]